MATHIKIPEILPVIRYVADGTQTEFTYPFPIFASEDLNVFFDGVSQSAGFDVSDIGETSGGAVSFNVAPPAGTIVKLERRLPLERMTDFLEGGDFSARAINNELDYLMASLQQVARDQLGQIRYDDNENPASVTLPIKINRANKALGFDAEGNPIAVPLNLPSFPTDFTASGTGAVTRSLVDKAADRISVMDYGAVGDGVTDDTLAIQKALNAHDHVYLPAGSYKISIALTLKDNQVFEGAGASSILIAANASVSLIEVSCSNASVRDMALSGGAKGLDLHGQTSLCQNNSFENLRLVGNGVGINLQAIAAGENACENHIFTHIDIESPSLYGVHFASVSGGTNVTTCAFINLKIASSESSLNAGCYVDAGSKISFINALFETPSAVSGLRLSANSTQTMIVNSSFSSGDGFTDLSGGSYAMIGPSDETSQINDLKISVLRQGAESHAPTSSPLNLDPQASLQLLSAASGAFTLNLPDPSAFEGGVLTLKKTDSSGNAITVTHTGASKPDGEDVILAMQGQTLALVAQGSAWHVLNPSSRGFTSKAFTGSGTYNVDMEADIYILTTSGGAINAYLPNASDPLAVGRQIIFKKLGSGSYSLYIYETGGSGVDGVTISLGSSGRSLTAYSDGVSWHMINKI